MDPDATEGFESVEGENDQEKQQRKENHKKAKEAFKNKVKDYDLNKNTAKPRIDSIGSSQNRNKINPQEFVIGDSGSQAIDDGFAEKEKPSYADEESEIRREKSVQLQSFTEPVEEKSSTLSIVERSHTTEAINPEEFQIKDDLSKFDEKDFSDNSKSNYAKGINKNLKRQKKFEQQFEKAHGTKLNKDLEINSEQSVRLGESGKKTRPKTAYKEVHKPDAPGVGEIAIPFKSKGPVSQEKEIEMARKKLFKKLKSDKMK